MTSNATIYGQLYLRFVGTDMVRSSPKWPRLLVFTPVNGLLSAL